MPNQTLQRIHNYWFVLAGQIFLIFLGGFMEDSIVLYALFTFSLLFIYGSIMRTIWHKRLYRTFSLIVGLLALILTIISLIMPVSWEEFLFDFIALTSACYAFFILIAIFAIGKFVFITDRVTVNRIVGSICVYLLIGMFFTFVYTCLGITVPHAFDIGGKTLGKMETFRDYLYYSYVTLTTTGYGDMLPTAPITKMLTIMETIIGPLYLAIMVARLVGMQISQGIRERDK